MRPSPNSSAHHRERPTFSGVMCMKIPGLSAEYQSEGILPNLHTTYFTIVHLLCRW